MIIRQGNDGLLRLKNVSWAGGGIFTKNLGGCKDVRCRAKELMLEIYVENDGSADRKAFSLARLFTPHWAAGFLWNREKARLEYRNCEQAKCTRGKDGKICMETSIMSQLGDEFRSFRKQNARKHGEIKWNEQNKVSKGDYGNFARDFPQNAPHVLNDNTLKGQGSPQTNSMIRFHGSRKIREVSGTGGRRKVVETRQCDYGFRNDQKMSDAAGTRLGDHEGKLLFS